jgi:hypothetical protein
VIIFLKIRPKTVNFGKKQPAWEWEGIYAFFPKIRLDKADLTDFDGKKQQPHYGNL